MRVLILGGNRFFGKKLALNLVNKGWEVTLLNRGNSDDGLGDQVKRIVCDRSNFESFKSAVSGQSWDIVYDQICYDYKDAEQTSEALKGRTSKLIFTSSQSVYKIGKALVEDDYQAVNHSFDIFAKKESNYSEAKRQAEASFEKHASFPVTCVRFPIVVGHDDYTERFTFHLNRIKESKPIYFPNLEAKISFISSDFAAEALAFLGSSDYSGPINAASPAPISLKRFIQIIESGTEKKANLIKEEIENSHSPYGIKDDWYIDCGKLATLGLKADEIERWLPKLLS